MKTAEQVQQEVTKLGIKITTNKNSFKELNKYIKDSEEIISMLDSAISLGVLTNERILSLETSVFSPTDAKEISLKNISNMQIDAGFLTTDLKIIGVGIEIKFVVGKKDDALKFKNQISDEVSKANQPVASQQIDVASQLEKLASLKDKGILTEQEFAEQKKKLLSL